MWIGILIVIITLFFDQGSKLLIEQNLIIREQINIIPDFLYFTKEYNTGAAWSIFDDSTIVLACISGIATLFIVYFFVKADFKKKKLYSVAISLILSGCYGNFIDRVICISGNKVRIGVLDFIGVYIFDYRFPIFNIADSCLTIGFILLFIDILFLEDKRKKIEAKVSNNELHN